MLFHNTKKRNLKHNKALGQNFLKDEEALELIADLAQINSESCIFEIGCGSGQLSKKLLAHPLKKLLIAEIDERWITYMHENIKDKRMTIIHQDISQFDLTTYQPQLYKKWTIAANIPYNVTHAILLKIIAWKSILDNVILTMQEEVAQKLIKTSGRDYTTLSLLIQHHFNCTLHTKLPPSAFNPAPKVYSRIIQFIPKTPLHIINEAEFWQFTKIIFSQPRRTIANNLLSKNAQYNIPENIHTKRAQELSYETLVDIWNNIQS